MSKVQNTIPWLITILASVTFPATTDMISCCHVTSGTEAISGNTIHRNVTRMHLLYIGTYDIDEKTQHLVNMIGYKAGSMGVCRG